MREHVSEVDRVLNLVAPQGGGCGCASYDESLMPVPESATAFLNTQLDRLRNLHPKRRIVFPEGDDPRVKTAAERLRREGLLTPILLKANAALSDQDLRKYGRLYFERRRAKGLTEIEALEVAKRPL